MKNTENTIEVGDCFTLRQHTKVKIKTSSSGTYEKEIDPTWKLQVEKMNSKTLYCSVFKTSGENVTYPFSSKFKGIMVPKNAELIKFVPFPIKVS